MLWRKKDLWRSWWEVPDPCWGNEGLTWHSLWASKDKHNPFLQKWYRSVSFPVLRVYNIVVWRFLDVYTTAIQNHDQYDAFFCIYQYMYHFACLPHAFYFAFLVLRLFCLCSSFTVTFHKTLNWWSHTSGAGITDRRHQTWLSPHFKTWVYNILLNISKSISQICIGKKGIRLHGHSCIAH